MALLVFLLFVGYAVGEHYLMTAHFKGRSVITREELSAYATARRLSWIVGAALFTVASVGVLIYALHRVYGPIMAVNRFLRRLIAGHYHERLSFRRGDQFKDTADLLNELADTLQRRHGSPARPGTTLLAPRGAEQSPPQGPTAAGSSEKLDTDGQ
jgi:hypothetical protein